MNFTTSAALSDSSSVLSNASSSPSNYNLPNFLLFPFSIEHYLPSLASHVQTAVHYGLRVSLQKPKLFLWYIFLVTHIAFLKKINMLGDTYF